MKSIWRSGVCKTGFSGKNLFFKWLFMTCHRQHIIDTCINWCVLFSPIDADSSNVIGYSNRCSCERLHTSSHLFTYWAFFGLDPFHRRTVKDVKEQHGSASENLERTELFGFASQKLKACCSTYKNRIQRLSIWIICTCTCFIYT